MQKLHYEWDRFWCPPEASLSLQDGGYLVDPHTEWGRGYNPNVVPFAEIAATRCLVLLGEPGIGKSSAIAREYGRTQQLALSAGSLSPLSIDLRAYGEEGRLSKRLTEASDIRSWAESDAMLDLFLDSLDECLLRVDTLAAMLPDALESLPTDRLRLRVACRTGDWPQTLESGLRKLWGEEGVGVYELTPLRRADVAMAAAANHLDAEEFLNEVAEREAQALANRPITLDFLIREKRKGGQLPVRRAVLYLNGCRFLAAENNEARLDAKHRGTIDADERLRMAGRIAAATVFGNRYAVWTGPEAGSVPQEDVTFHEFRGPSSDSVGPSDSALEELLGTGLFTSRGPNRMGWAHQTYAEFLAARWMIESRLDLDQILGLLANPHDPQRRLVPQLHETAAWIASMRPDVFSMLTELDPDALLRGDVATADAEQRRVLTQALLDGYQSERIIDTDWGVRPLYRKLAHSGLHGQLRPYIADPKMGFIVRRAAINIGEACRVTDLQDDLIRVALNSAEPIGLRDEAAHAAALVADAEHRPRLRALLVLDSKEDPDDQLRGHALEALWPEHLSAEELFRSLTPVRRSNLYGQYKRFIHTYLPATLTDDDLPAALQWVREHAPVHHHAHRDVLEELADEILFRVWQSNPQGAMLGLFADIVVLRIQHHEPIIGRESGRVFSELVWEEEERRHALVLALLERITTNKQLLWSVWHPGRPLVNSGDVPWLLDWLVHGRGAEGAKCLGAELVSRLFDRGDSELVSSILEATLRSDPLRNALAHLTDPVELNSPRAAELKSAHEERYALEARLIQQEQPGPAALDPAPAGRVQAALEECEAGDPDGFWKLTMELSLSSTSTRYEEVFDPDLTSLPGWQEADQRTRERIIEAAKRYLRERDPEPERWLGVRWWYRPAFAGYKALRLVLSADPVFVSGLTREDWERWAPVIVVYPFINSDPHHTIHKKLCCVVYRTAPERVIDALGCEIDRDNRSHGIVFGLEHFEDCWDDRLSGAVLYKAVEPNIQPAAFERLLGAALSHGLVEATAYACSLVQLPISGDAEERVRAVTAAALLLQLVPDQGWDVVWAAFEADEDFGRNVIAAVANSHERQKLREGLSERRLAALFAWVERRYPYADDPDDDVAVGVGAGDQVRWFKMSLLDALRDRGSFEAVRALEWCINELPQLEWLKYTLHDARASARSKTWLPPRPAEVLRLGEAHNGRLVRSGRELLDAVAASLGRLERKLQGETPAAVDLWNGPDAAKSYQPKDENALSNYVKRHLQEDLASRGVVVNREVEIRRGEGDAKGENTDIHVNALIRDPRGGVLDALTVIIEAKGCWHRELSSAMETQLVGRYLRDNPCRHGIYLVGWYNCPQWTSADYRRQKAPKKSLEEARQQFDSQAAQLSVDDLEVRAFVLNTALRG